MPRRLFKLSRKKNSRSSAKSFLLSTLVLIVGSLDLALRSQTRPTSNNSRGNLRERGVVGNERESGRERRKGKRKGKRKEKTKGKAEGNLELESFFPPPALAVTWGHNSNFFFVVDFYDLYQQCAPLSGFSSPSPPSPSVLASPMPCLLSLRPTRRCDYFLFGMPCRRPDLFNLPSLSSFSVLMGPHPMLVAVEW